MKIKVLVVVYNKSLEESVTLSSLLKSGFSGFHLVVVNNGPHAIPDKSYLYDNFSSVEYLESLHNKPLSHIYNDFIIDDQSLYDYYFIFDDDTSICEGYFGGLLLNDYNNYDLLVPLIYDGDVINYPKVDGHVIDDSIKELQNIKGFLTIGSGLILTRRLVNRLKKNNIEPFDSRFALYGVDFSFFKILSRFFGYKLRVSIFGKINHSLSSNIEGFSSWRHRERLYDVVLMAKFYSKTPFHYLYRLLNIIINEVKFKRVRFIPLIIKISFSKKHPRC